MSPLQCKKCEKEIKEGKYSILEEGATFHSECFTCASCNKELNETSLVGEDKGYYHQDCFDIKFAKTCSFCTGRIKASEGGSVIIGQNKYSHGKCFTCFNCKKPLTDRFMEKVGRYFDPECFQTLFSLKCDKCTKPFPLGTSYSEVNGKKYHKECFQCSKCSSTLSGKQFSVIPKDNSFVCQSCVQKDVEARSKRAQERLEKEKSGSGFNAAPAPAASPKSTLGRKAQSSNPSVPVLAPKPVLKKVDKKHVESPLAAAIVADAAPAEVQQQREENNEVNDLASKLEVSKVVEPEAVEQQQQEQPQIQPAVEGVQEQPQTADAQPEAPVEAPKEVVPTPAVEEPQAPLALEPTLRIAPAEEIAPISEQQQQQQENISETQKDGPQVPFPTQVSPEPANGEIDHQLNAVANALNEVKKSASSADALGSSNSLSIDKQENQGSSQPSTQFKKIEQSTASLPRYNSNQSFANQPGSLRGSFNNLNVLHGQPKPVVAQANYHAHSPKTPRHGQVPTAALRSPDGRVVQNLANCTRCRRPCYPNEAFLTLKDNITHFHRECFVCEICANPLNRKYAMKNGKFYHAECYQAAKQNAPKCMKCYQQINPSEISVALGNDTRFHRQCFACDACARPLSERFYTQRGQFLHEDCIKCDSCSRKLLGINFSQLEDGGFVCDPCLQVALQPAPVEGSTLIQEVASYVDRPLPAQVQYYRDNYEEGFAQRNQVEQGNGQGGFVPQVNTTPRYGNQQAQDNAQYAGATLVDSGQLVQPNQ